MKMGTTVIALAVGTLFALPALAQNAADVVQRNVNQQQRIEDGLKSGQLSTKEAAKLESKEIARAKHNGVTGDPNSASSQRMQADVQRNVNQEARIEQGVKSGQLTNREVGSLERGQARVDRKEARAGADGHVSANEQHNVQAAEDHQSKRIHQKKHNDRVRE